LHRAGAGAGILRKVRFAPFADMQHGGPVFEKHEAVFLEDRQLPERLRRAVVGFVLIALFQEARPVGEARLLQRPAYAQIAHLALGKVRNPFESGDRDFAMFSFAIFAAQACSLSKVPFPSPTWLSRRSTLRKGLRWKVWTVRPSRSSNVIGTSVSTPADGPSMFHAKVKTRRAHRTYAR